MSIRPTRSSTGKQNASSLEMGSKKGDGDIVEYDVLKKEMEIMKSDFDAKLKSLDECLKQKALESKEAANIHSKLLLEYQQIIVEWKLKYTEAKKELLDSKEEVIKLNKDYKIQLEEYDLAQKKLAAQNMELNNLKCQLESRKADFIAMETSLKEELALERENLHRATTNSVPRERYDALNDQYEETRNNCAYLESELEKAVEEKKRAEKSRLEIIKQKKEDQALFISKLKEKPDVRLHPFSKQSSTPYAPPSKSAASSRQRPFYDENVSLADRLERGESEYKRRQETGFHKKRY